MSQITACPLCTMENIYPDGDNHVCADCGHEWPIAASADAADGGVVVRDVNGNVLNSGDTVTVIKDLKVKGSSIPLKQRGADARNDSASSRAKASSPPQRAFNPASTQ